VKNKKQPSRRQATVLRQLVELIPSYLVPKLARVHGVDRRARTFSPWSHVVALLYAQMAHALSLNDVCDALRLWATPLRALRGASAPSRNNLSHANKTRDCAMAEDLFWKVLGHLQGTFPAFGRGPTKGLAWRFHRTIHVVDATVIQLVASCLDWAKHRRRKAAAKCHLRLSLRSLLPGFVVIDTAREHDSRRARQLCAGLREGEIVLFDKGYYELAHFQELEETTIDKSDPDCVWRKRLVQVRNYQNENPDLTKPLNALVATKPVFQIWSPVAAVALLVKLEMPFRLYQVRMLDSGESDHNRIEIDHDGESAFLKGKGTTLENIEHREQPMFRWSENQNRQRLLDGLLKPDRGRVSQHQGVFVKCHDHKVGDFVGFFINTNKTADIDKEWHHRGYHIRWQHNSLHRWLVKLRNWQEKYAIGITA